jgi:hypothetical protein
MPYGIGKLYLRFKKPELAKERTMKIPLHTSELLNLVTRLNFEIQEQIIDSINATAGPAYVIAWNQFGDESRMEVRSDTKMVELLSIVVPTNIIDMASQWIPLSGARLEVVGAWRVDSEQPWMRNYCFGDAGTLVLTLPSFDPEHIKAAAITLAETISKYLDAQLELC